MTERGGPTTQSGILFQNSVTALRSGRMLDPIERPDSETIVIVRAEAPTSVDDTVLTFRDGHREFIQAKEAITEEAWRKLWSDVSVELQESSFDRERDRIVLVFGESPPRVANVRGAADRAKGSTQMSEWFNRLTAAQRDTVHDIAVLTGFGEQSPHLLELFASLHVEVVTRESIERDLIPHWIPASTFTMVTLFRLLRDRVGGEARIRAEFRKSDLLESLINENRSFRITAVSDADIERAAAASSASLKTYRGTFGNTGHHLDRQVVDEVHQWLSSSESEGTIAMLLDEAGAGKSVVVSDLLNRLAAEHVFTLAMKADMQLTGVTSADDVQQSLRLPESVERVVERLSRTAPVVVIIDQIDALSLTLAHDARTLDVVLDLVARLTLIPRVRLLISCRAFDRSNDVRLRRLEAKKEFRSVELTEAEITTVLSSASVQFAALTENTRRLLRLPLHLDLYLLVSATRGEQPATLQDLYAALLRNVALRDGPALPSISLRLTALKVLTAAMYDLQRTSVPATFFIDHGGDALHTAAAWLASEGVLLHTESGWAFRHQTLFDYLFARDFVDSGRSLIEHLRSTPQGLESRAALVQVLSYQRGTSPARYLAELDAIWRAEDIRFHLRHLLMRWFGTLPNPNADEIRWARRLLPDGENRKQLLSAARGNAAWFRALRPELESLLHRDTEAANEVMWLFVGVMTPCQREIVAIMRPYIGRGDEWLGRCRWLLSYTREWTDFATIEFFDEVMQQGGSLPQHFMEFKDMGRLDPERTATAVLHLLDRQIAAVSEDGNSGSSEVIHSLRVFSETDLDEALDIIADGAPITWLNGTISWLERALASSSLGGGTSHTFRHDSLALWSDNFHDDFETHLQHSVLRALIVLGDRNAPEFQPFIRRLAAIPYITAQILVAQTYARLDGRYASEACDFLLSDARRFWLGSASAIHTRRLIAAIFRHLPPTSRTALEAAVAAHLEFERDDPIAARRWSGLERFYLFSAIPDDLISDESRRRCQELQRKFPAVDISLERDESGLRAMWEHSPIETANARKMRDDDWLRAMQKYVDREPAWDDLTSARALGDVLKEEAKKDPQRFAKLAERLPDDVQDFYVAGLIDGLVETSSAFGAVVALVRRFAPQQGRDLRRTVSWAMRKQPCDVPSDVVDLLELWVRDEGLDNEHARATLDYLNIDRGSAFLTLCYVLQTQDRTQNIERRWRLYDFVASTGTEALRAAAIEQMLYELHDRRDEVLDMFDRLMKGHETALLDAHPLPQFLHAAIWKTFSRIQSVIFDLIASPKEKHHEVGARLIAVAAISPRALTSDELSLARGVIDALIARNLPKHKIALARILANNVDDLEADFCFERLARLFDDTDPKVRGVVGHAFSRMTGYDLETRGAWLTTYAASPALSAGLREFAEYILNYGEANITRSLELIVAAIENRHPDEQTRWFDGRDFIRFVLAVDNDPTLDSTTKRRAMDVFDRLMEQYGDLAETILSEWDRR
jgi:uncharacterized protein (DUF2267 family)